MTESEVLDEATAKEHAIWGAATESTLEGVLDAFLDFCEEQDVDGSVFIEYLEEQIADARS